MIGVVLKCLRDIYMQLYLEIKWERVESMDGILEEGEEIKVKLIEVDRRTGKFRLSRKALIPKPEK